MVKYNNIKLMKTLCFLPLKFLRCNWSFSFLRNNFQANANIGCDY